MVLAYRNCALDFMYLFFAQTVKRTVALRRSATKTAHVTTNCHISVYASVQHSGKVMRALVQWSVQKAEWNGTLRHRRPHMLNPMMEEVLRIGQTGT